MTSLGVLQGSGTAAAPGDGEAILGARVEGDARRRLPDRGELLQPRPGAASPATPSTWSRSVMDHFGVAGDQYTRRSRTTRSCTTRSPARRSSNVDLPVKAIVLGGAGRPARARSSTGTTRIGDYVGVAMAPSRRRRRLPRASSPPPTSPPTASTTTSRPAPPRPTSPRTAAGRHVANAVAVFMPDGAPAPAPTPDAGTGVPTPAPDAAGGRTPAARPAARHRWRGAGRRSAAVCSSPPASAPPRQRLRLAALSPLRRTAAWRNLHRKRYVSA